MTTGTLTKIGKYEIGFEQEYVTIRQDNRATLVYARYLPLFQDRIDFYKMLSGFSSEKEIEHFLDHQV